MNSDDLGWDLHDRATRGEQLSPESQMRLDAWYAAQDRAEMEVLSGVALPRDSAVLRTQVETKPCKIPVWYNVGVANTVQRFQYKIVGAMGHAD